MSGYRPPDRRWNPRRGRTQHHPYHQCRRRDHPQPYSHRSPLCRDCDKEHCGSGDGHAPSFLSQHVGNQMPAEVKTRSPACNRGAKSHSKHDINNNLHHNNQSREDSTSLEQIAASETVAMPTVAGESVKNTDIATEEENGALPKNVPMTSDKHDSQHMNLCEDLCTSVDRHLLSGSDLEDDEGSSILDFDFDEVDVGNGGSSSPKITKRRRINSSLTQGSSLGGLSSPSTYSQPVTRSMSEKKPHKKDARDFLYLSEIMDKDFVELEGEVVDNISKTQFNELQIPKQENQEISSVKAKRAPSPKSCLKKPGKKSSKSKVSGSKALKRSTALTKKSGKKRKPPQQLNSPTVKIEASDDKAQVMSNSSENSSQVNKKTRKKSKDKSSTEPIMIADDDEEEVMRQLMEEQKYHIEQIKKRRLDEMNRSKNENKQHSTPNQSNLSLQALDSEYEWLSMYTPEEDSVSLYATKRSSNPPHKSTHKVNSCEKQVSTTSSDSPLPENLKKSVDLINVLLDFETQSQTQMAAETFFQTFISSKDELKRNEIVSITKRLANCLKKFEQFEYLEKLIGLTIDVSVSLDDDVYLALFKNLQQNQGLKCEDLLNKLVEKNLITEKLAEEVKENLSEATNKESQSTPQGTEDSNHSDQENDESSVENAMETTQEQTPELEDGEIIQDQIDHELSETFLKKHRILPRLSNAKTSINCVFSPVKDDEPTEPSSNSATPNTSDDVENVNVEQNGSSMSKPNSRAEENIRERGLLPTPDISANRRLLHDSAAKRYKCINVEEHRRRRPINSSSYPSSARDFTWDRHNRRRDCEGYDPPHPLISCNRKRPLPPQQTTDVGQNTRRRNDYKRTETPLDWCSLGKNFGELIATITSPSNEDNVMLIFLGAMLDGKLKDAPCFAQFVHGSKQIVITKYSENLPTLEKCLSRIAVSLVYQCNFRLAYNMIAYMRKNKMNYTSHLPVNSLNTNPCTIAIKFINVCRELKDFATASEIACDFFVNNKSMAIGPIQGQTVCSMLERLSQHCLSKKMFSPAVKFLQASPVAYCTGGEVKLLQEILICLLQVDSKDFDLIHIVVDLLLMRKQLLSMRVIFNNSPINKMSLDFYKHLEEKGIYCCPRIAQRPHLVFIPYTMGRSEMILALYRHFTALSLFLVDIKHRLRMDLPLRIVLLRNDIGHLKSLIPNKSLSDQYTVASALLKEVLLKIMMPTLRIQSVTNVRSTDEMMLNVDIRAVRDWLINNTDYGEVDK